MKMAKEPHSLELLLSYQVCFEEFTEKDEHISRLLPCTHTLCHSCVGQQIQGQKIDCPECRKKHEATDKEKSFPQNKYILTQIKRKSTKEQPAPHEFQKCEEHGKEMNMFCLETECNKPVCRSCLRTRHRRHDVTDIEELEKDALIKTVLRIEMNLEAKLNAICEVKRKMASKAHEVMEEMKNKKEEIVSHIDKMIQETEEQNKMEQMGIDDELATMNSKFDLLQNIRQNIEKEQVWSYEEIMNNQETVKEIEENNNANLPGVRSFWYLVFSARQFSVEENFGNVTKEELVISLPESETLLPLTTESVLPEIITNASQLKYSVTEITKTGMNGLLSITLFHDEIAVVCGSENLAWKIKSYNLQTGMELNCQHHQDACRLAKLELSGKQALAVSCGRKQKIEFRDVNDFSRILHNHSVVPHWPHVLCASSPHFLLYGDASTSPYEFHWLDLSDGQPKSAAGKCVIHTQNIDIKGVCIVQNGDKQLLIVADSYKEIFAYNTETSKLECEVDKNVSELKSVSGVATDGRGHLFVGNINNKCIKMFSVSDGQYLGCLMKDEETLGEPCGICWSESTSSLVVAHLLKRIVHLHAIRIN